MKRKDQESLKPSDGKRRRNGMEEGMEEMDEHGKGRKDGGLKGGMEMKESEWKDE